VLRQIFAGLPARRRGALQEKVRGRRHLRPVAREGLLRWSALSGSRRGSLYGKRD